MDKIAQGQNLRMTFYYFVLDTLIHICNQYQVPLIYSHSFIHSFQSIYLKPPAYEVNNSTCNNAQFRGIMHFVFLNDSVRYYATHREYKGMQ